MLRVDGAHGEGGGQILRSALTLSVLTGRPVELYAIRSGRKRPGLMPQHLKAVEGAAAVSRAVVEGAEVGSTALLFRPKDIVPGHYRFDIGTAGSAPLVLQTVLIPLALAPAPSRILIVGGTHVPHSPCFHYLERIWLPLLERIGYRVELQMPKAGFYPRGGGILEAVIAPPSALTPLRLTRRGPLRRIRLFSLVARLPGEIAERQVRGALPSASFWTRTLRMTTFEAPSAGPGTMLLAEADFDEARIGAFALGARGKPAETVGREAAEALTAILASTGATVDEHGADQLVLPLALVPGESLYGTNRITHHLETVAWVTRLFLPAEIAIHGEIGEPGTVSIRGVEIHRPPTH